MERLDSFLFSITEYLYDMAEVINVTLIMMRTAQYWGWVGNGQGEGWG